jgi:hypothetical protein
MLLNLIKALMYTSGITTHLSDVVLCHLIELKLRQLHCCFSYPLARQIYKVLKRIGYKTNLKEITKLIKVYD